MAMIRLRHTPCKYIFLASLHLSSGMALALNSPPDEQAITQELHSPEYNDLLENQAVQQEPGTSVPKKDNDMAVWEQETTNVQEDLAPQTEDRAGEMLSESINTEIDQGLEQTLNEELQTLVNEKEHVEAYIPKEQEQRLAKFNATGGKKGPRTNEQDRVPSDIKEEVAREMESDEISTSAAAPVRQAASVNRATLAPSLEEKVIGSIENDTAVELEARHQQIEAQSELQQPEERPSTGLHLRRRRAR